MAKRILCYVVYFGLLVVALLDFKISQGYAIVRKQDDIRINNYLHSEERFHGNFEKGENRTNIIDYLNNSESNIWFNWKILIILFLAPMLYLYKKDNNLNSFLVVTFIMFSYLPIISAIIDGCLLFFPGYYFVRLLVTIILIITAEYQFIKKEGNVDEKV